MTDAISSSAATSAATATSVSQAQQSLAGDQTTFLKLLTTQLKNQDPLSPLDANAFTAQLVQMTGVQQQITTNQLLTQMVAAQGGVGNAVGLIGKQVTAGTAAATLQDGQANWNYSLAGAAGDVTLQVVDSSGNTVFQQDAGALGQGDHTFTWNGKDLTGLQRGDGTTYGLRVVAKAASGDLISSSVALKGTVSSVSQADGETVVEVNGTQVPLDLISSVRSTS